MSLPIRARSFFWLLGLALLVATAAGAGWVLNHSSASEGTSQAPPPRDPDAPGAKGIVCMGFVDVRTKVAELTPVQPGRVVWVIEENKDVQKGEVLLRLDDRMARLKADQARAAVQDGEAQLAQAQQGTKDREYKLEQQEAAVAGAEYALESARQQAAYKAEQYQNKTINEHEKLIYDRLAKKVEALLQVERAKLKELKLLDPQLAIDRAKADVSGKRAQYEEAKLALQECELKAPSDGTVLRVLTGVGEVLGSNPRAPAAIQFAPKGARVIRAEVLQEWAGKVREGQSAVIEDDTTSGPKWQGEVKEVGGWFTQRRQVIQEPFQYNDVRTLECLVLVTGPESQPLRINQRVRVTIKQGGP